MTHRRLGRVHLAVIFTASALIVSASAQTRRAMTVDDVLDIVQVSAPKISPDGSRILYMRSELGAWKDNKRKSSVWIVDADGSHDRPFLADDKDKSPAWSPDGRHVAFVSTRGETKPEDAVAQVWIIPADGGEATKLTDHKGAVRAFEWTKDSRSIVFLADRPTTDAEKAARKAGDDAIDVDEGPNGQERGDFAELWRVSIADRQEQPILCEPLVIDGFRMSPDGGRAAIIYRRENSRNGQFHDEIGVVDTATGALKDITHNEAPEQRVQWSPDGRTLSYLAPSDTVWDLAEEKLWLVPASGGTPRRLASAFKGAIGDYFWAADGKAIVFGATSHARGGVFRVDTSTGSIQTVASGDWDGLLSSVSDDGRRGAAAISSPAAPAEVETVDLASGKLAPVTRAGAHITDFSLSQFRAITWKSTDGTEIEGMLWLPSDYKPGTKLPLLLSVHGGPAGSWDVSFRGIDHVYTGLGWAVLEPNVRGSRSYGDALLRGNMKDIGGGDYQDLMTGVDKLVADGIADPEHLAIRGWSYGGILGGWTITRTPRFKAASLGAMVTDWSSEYAMGFNFDVSRWYIGGTPWDNAAAYRRQSSYSAIAQVTTPTLLLHGERDTTDTIGQSMMFYQGLKDRGVPVRFIRFPREPHGFREPHHQRIRDTEEIRWLMKYARGIDWTAPERKDAAPEKKTTDR